MAHAYLDADPVTVIAHVLPGKPAQPTAAAFNLWGWAQSYAETLRATGDYAEIHLSSADHSAILDKDGTWR